MSKKKLATEVQDSFNTRNNEDDELSAFQSILPSSVVITQTTRTIREIAETGIGYLVGACKSVNRYFWTVKETFYPPVDIHMPQCIDPRQSTNPNQAPTPITNTQQHKKPLPSFIRTTTTTTTLP